MINLQRIRVEQTNSVNAGTVEPTAQTFSLTQITENGAQLADIDGPVAAVIKYVEGVGDCRGRTRARRG